jgi:hypothetical protein
MADRLWGKWFHTRQSQVEQRPTLSEDEMVTLPGSGLLLAGFVLAHAAWSVSDLPKGELLTPLAMVERGGQRSMTRFEATSQEVAISQGKAAMAKLGKSPDAWAFAREGLIREHGSPVDVLTVDVWAKGMKAPASLIQRFEPFAAKGRFRLIGDPVFVVGGVLQPPSVAKPWLTTLMQGVHQHPKVAALWSTWK